MSFARSALTAATSLAVIVAITGAVRLYPAVAARVTTGDTILAELQPIDVTPSFRTLAPPPSMIGAPVVFTGPYAGRFPNRAWLQQANKHLNAIGFANIESCEQRTTGSAYAYVPNCDGRLVLVSDMYTAAAALTRPEPTVSEDPPELATRDRIPDIVDSTVPLRLQTYGGLFKAGDATNSSASQPASNYSGSYYTALNEPVPQPASRSAAPQLLPLPAGAVSDPLPQVANSHPLGGPQASAGARARATQTSGASLRQVNSPERVDRPVLSDYVPASGPENSAQEVPGQNRHSPASTPPA